MARAKGYYVTTKMANKQQQTATEQAKATTPVVMIEQMFLFQQFNCMTGIRRQTYIKSKCTCTTVYDKEWLGN